MYKYLDKVAMADAAFKVENRHLSELFQESAQALFSLMTNLSAVQPINHKIIRLKADALDQLLFDWLSELVFLKDRDAMLFSKFNVSIAERKNGYLLKADVAGEGINPEKHELRADVKAITYHMFYLKNENGVWRTRVVLDI